MIEAPFSELDYSSDYLDEFHGFTDEEDNGDGFNERICPGEDFQESDNGGIPLRNRNGDIIKEDLLDDEERKDSGAEDQLQINSHDQP